MKPCSPGSPRRAFLAGFLALLALASAFPAEPFVLAGSQDSEAVPELKWVVLVYAEVFRRLGYDFRYEVYPLARLSVLADSGEVDGEIQRPGDYQESHPDLVRVEEPHSVVRYTAYAVKPGIAVKGWASLKGTAYRVEYRRGLSRAETELQVLVPPGNLTDITTTEQGLKKLIQGRTDIFVDLDYNVRHMLKVLAQSGFDTSSVYDAGALQERYVYAFLHKKHADLMPKVAETLRELKREGVVEEYRALVYGN